MNDMLLSIGEALIDFMPDKIGCEFDEVTAFLPKIGGAPANVCGAYAALGGSAKLITKLGDDPFGHKIVKELEKYGIDTGYVSFTDRANTALAFVSLGEKGTRTFSFYRKPSADMLYSKEDLKKEYFEGVYTLHFCSVSLGDFPMKEAHKVAIEYAREEGGIISFDPNLRFQLWESHKELKKTVWDFIPLADVLKISDDELEFLTDETDTEKGIEKLFAGNVKLVVYTCGENGARAFTKKISVGCGAKKVEAVDTTGAGDGFIGSFLWKMKELGIKDVREFTEKQLSECLVFASEFCGISVTRYGAIASYPRNVAF